MALMLMSASSTKLDEDNSDHCRALQDDNKRIIAEDEKTIIVAQSAKKEDLRENKCNVEHIVLQALERKIIKCKEKSIIDKENDKDSIKKLPMLKKLY